MRTSKRQKDMAYKTGGVLFYASGIFAIIVMIYFCWWPHISQVDIMRVQNTGTTYYVATDVYYHGQSVWHTFQFNVLPEHLDSILHQQHIGAEYILKMAKENK